MRLQQILTESLSSRILYHGSSDLITEFRIPPYGAYFSPHKDWAENYGDVITSVRVFANNVYVIDYTHDIDDKLIDSLFDRDYGEVARFIQLLQSQGYDAMQSVTDSEMVVAFPGTKIQIVDNS